MESNDAATEDLPPLPYRVPTENMESNGVESNGVESNGVESNGVESNGVESNGVESDNTTIEDLPRLSTCPVNNGIRGLSDSDIHLVCSLDLVKFLIGPSKKEYYLSKPLVASLTGPPPSITDPIDWSEMLDKDIFTVFVQYAYTGGYGIPTDLDHDIILRAHQVYSEARSKEEGAYSIYESSPFVETPCPASVYRQHAQIWAFAASSHVHGLEEVATRQLRIALEDLMETTRSGSYLGLEEGKCREVVDVIGYVYHQGRRFWGSEMEGMTRVPLSGMELSLAWFARRYLIDFIEDSRDGQSGWEYHGSKERKLEMWDYLLEREPRIAVDMVRINMKKVSYKPVRVPR